MESVGDRAAQLLAQLLPPWENMGKREYTRYVAKYVAALSCEELRIVCQSRNCNAAEIVAALVGEHKQFQKVGSK